MRASQLISIVLSGFVLSGCAGFTFYKTADLKEETGIPICPANPYLLLKRTGAKEKPVEVSIEYISDRSEAIYAKPNSGWGSADLSLALSNCQLTSFGQKTDPKIAETLASVSGLITAKAGADKTGAEVDQIRQALAGTMQGAPSAVETGAAVVAVAEDMTKHITDNKLSQLLANETETVKSAAQALMVAGNALKNPANVNRTKEFMDAVKAQAKSLGELPEVPSAGENTRGEALGKIHAWAEQLNKIVGKAESDKPEPPTFELYQITRKDGKTTLKRVDLNDGK